MKTQSLHCPNCSAPLTVPIGATEALCEYCGSQLRHVPGEEELAVVRTREEMKYRERVAVQKAALRQKMKEQELDKWRETAAKVAVTALPMVGDAAGRALFRAALQRSSGCAGCGCLAALVAVGAILAALFGLLS